MNDLRSNKTRPIEGSSYLLINKETKLHVTLTVIAEGFLGNNEFVFYTIDRLPGELGFLPIECWGDFGPYEILGRLSSINDEILTRDYRGRYLYRDIQVSVFKRGTDVFLNDPNGKALLCIVTTS